MAKDSSMHIDFSKMTKNELMLICDRYRKYLEYNICRTYQTKRVDVDSKEILDDFISGMNWNQLSKKYELDVQSIKLRMQRELACRSMAEVLEIKKELEKQGME